MYCLRVPYRGMERENITPSALIADRCVHHVQYNEELDACSAGKAVPRRRIPQATSRLGKCVFIFHRFQASPLIPLRSKDLHGYFG